MAGRFLMPGLCDIPPISAACQAGGGVASSVADSAWKAVCDDLGDAMASVMKTMLTFWTQVPSPDVAGGGVVATVQSYTYWVQGFVLVLSFLIVAGKLCVGQSIKPAGEAAKGLVTLVIVNGAGVAGIDILAKAGDAWSGWIINQSAGGDFGSRLISLTGGSAVLGPLGTGLEFTIAFLGILAAIGQLLLLIARIGILTVLTGVLPIAASAIGTESGKQWFQKLVSWILAFVLYKPAAALVYATAFTLIGSGTDITSFISGLMLVALAILALPALMRLAVPMVGAATSGGGGAVAGAVAGAALATGARQIGDHRGGSTSAPTHRPGLTTASSGPRQAAATGSKATWAGPIGTVADGALRARQAAAAGAESATGST